MKISIKKTSTIQKTGRVQQLCGMFDVPPSMESAVEWEAELPVESRPWNVGLIVGPSGCGKTTIARELFGAELIHGFEWPADRSIVDAFPAGMSIKEITALLSSVGFSSPPSWLRPFHVLSNGEQFRVTVARALAEQPALAVIDEFTSVVDRQVAQVGSHAVAKAVRKRGQKFVAVACHYDIVDWLDPDWVFEPHTGQTHWRSERQARPAVHLEIIRCRPSGWHLFKSHHYLSTDHHRSAICFMAIHDGRPVAWCSVLAFPHPTVPGWREHRCVVLPDYQGLGIGERLSSYVASLFNKRFRTTSGHPAVAAGRMRSADWKVTRSQSFMSGKHQGTRAGMSATRSSSRFTSSFEYVGPKNREEAIRFGVKW